MLKKTIAILLALFMVMTLFTACQENVETVDPSEEATSSAAAPADEPADEETSGEEYPDKDPSKETIRIAAVRPLSGDNVSFEYYNYGPIYKMWVDEVNAAGGIRVEEYGNRQLTIELIVTMTPPM